MKIIVGLGNPGSEYRYTRHNVGFLLVDFLAEEIDSSWTNNTSVKSSVSKSLEYLLAKPQTFMNKSGDAVSLLLRYFKLPVESLYVVHDDLDLPLGEYKIQNGVGPKVHNGVNSVENSLGVKDFWRIRIGVDNRNQSNRIPGEAYVLQNFEAEEQDLLEKIFPEICQKVLQK